MDYNIFGENLANWGQHFLVNHWGGGNGKFGETTPGREGQGEWGNQIWGYKLKGPLLGPPTIYTQSFSPPNSPTHAPTHQRLAQTLGVNATM